MEAKIGDLEDGAASSTKSLESETKVESLIVPAPATTPATTVATENVSDPDEDDLDDLDDMLDEFSPANTDTKRAQTTSGPGRPEAATKVADDEGNGLSDDDFERQLQAGMADLLGELGNDPDMKAQFDEMMKSLSGAGGLGQFANLDATTPVATSSKTAPSTKDISSGVPTEESFQETIKKTMDRMQASGDKATAASTEDNSDDIFAELMKQMGSGALGGEGGEEDFSKMLLGMMEQLTNKEILYEPMKELDDKFPEWMKKNKEATSKEDMARYEEQAKVVKEIVDKFEEKSYSDSNAADREYIVERMQKMQAAGSPPPDLVGDMAAAQEAFGVPGGMDDGCAQQ